MSAPDSFPLHWTVLKKFDSTLPLGESYSIDLDALGGDLSPATHPIIMDQFAVTVSGLSPLSALYPFSAPAELDEGYYLIDAHIDITGEDFLLHIASDDENVSVTEHNVSLVITPPDGYDTPLYRQRETLAADDGAAWTSLTADDNDFASFPAHTKIHYQGVIRMHSTAGGRASSLTFKVAKLETGFVTVHEGSYVYLTRLNTA